MTDRQFIIEAIASVAERLPIRNRERLVVTRQGRLVVIDGPVLLPNLCLLRNGLSSRVLSALELRRRISDHCVREFV